MPVRVALAIVLCLLAAPLAVGQNVLRDDFEGPETSLRDGGGDANYKVDVHRRVDAGAHSGRWCEQISLRGNNGTYVYFTHAIAAARVINELTPSIWVRADRPGLQILARVTLPRSVDERTGKPISTYLRGSGYTQVGAWQQLRIENLPAQLNRQVRVLRAKFGPNVDEREAYVDLVLLNVYGGPDVTNAWFDDLEIAGVVAPQSPVTPSPTSQPPPSSAPTAAPTPAAPRALQASIQSLPAVWADGQSAPKVELESGLLLVAGKPFFPRVIEHRGEPLAKLQSLGFNAVRLAQVPTGDQLREASRLGLWLVAPPPAAEELESRTRGANGGQIGAAFDPVLVWDLGGRLASRELETTRSWAKLVEAADPRRRPIICDADSDLRSYTRPPVSLFLARRDPLGTSLPLRDYITWLRERSQLVLAGTPLWSSVQTQPSPALAEQIALVSSSRPLVIDEAHLRMLVRSALAAGSRGLCFESHSRLDIEDPATERRAALLELLNLELGLIDRWPAGGSSTAGAASNDPHSGGAVIETDRSRLLMPIYAPPGGQFVLGNPTVKPLTFVVPGVPEGNDAYELSPTVMRPVNARRVVGGTQVALNGLERDSLIVFTQDAAVFQNLATRVSKMKQRASQLQRAVAAAQLAEVEFVEQRLAEAGRAIPATRQTRVLAANELRECDAALARNDPKTAYDHARGTLETLRDIERRHWEQAVPNLDLSLEDPLTAHFATLAEHYRFAHEIGAAPRSANFLADGGFEDLQAMVRSGWKHFQHQQPGVTTTVELTPEAVHAGRNGLRLRAVADDPKNQPAVIETPPVWITSAAVNVERGQLVQIQFWLRIAQQVTGSVDGLLVVDTLAGDALAHRATNQADWRQVTYYRAAPRSGPMSLTFALCGLGDAWIDDVSVQVIERRAAIPPQQAQNARPLAPGR